MLEFSERWRSGRRSCWHTIQVRIHVRPGIVVSGETFLVAVKSHNFTAFHCKIMHEITLAVKSHNFTAFHFKIMHEICVEKQLFTAYLTYFSNFSSTRVSVFYFKRILFCLIIYIIIKPVCVRLARIAFMQRSFIFRSLVSEKCNAGSITIHPCFIIRYGIVRILVPKINGKGSSSAG